MFPAFVITLREGLEAFLIVAISLAYLRRSGRASLTRAVYWGIGAAIALSALGGYLLYNASNQEAVLNDYRYATQQVVTGIPFFPTLGVKGTF